MEPIRQPRWGIVVNDLDPNTRVEWKCIKRKENEDVVNEFLQGNPDFSLVPMHEVLEEQKIALEMGDYLKMLPQLHHTDGFFAAVLVRKK